MVLSPRTFNGALSYEVVRTSRPAEPGQVGLVASQTPQSNPYFFGTGFITRSDLGIQISTGLDVKLIARTGQRVQYANMEVYQVFVFIHKQMQLELFLYLQVAMYTCLILS